MGFYQREAPARPRALNRAKSMIPAIPLSLTKRQSQSIALDPAVTNSYIHIDTPGKTRHPRRQAWRDGRRDKGICFSLLFFVSLAWGVGDRGRWGVLVIAPPARPPALLSVPASCKLLRHLLFPQRSVPVKSARDVSLSQLWVKNPWNQ